MYAQGQHRVIPIIPAGLLTLLNTLVAPGFPLPTEKISTPARFATKTPKGIEPKIYPAKATPTVSTESIFNGTKG